MGVDYYIYVGPYIEVKTAEMPKRKGGVTSSVCKNLSCKNRGVYSNQKFCPQCGSPIITAQEEIEERMSLDDIMEECEGEPIYPDRFSNQRDVDIWIPHHESLRSSGGNVKYDDIFDDMSDVDINAEIQKVRDICKVALEKIEKIYGIKPSIKWGVMSSSG